MGRSNPETVEGPEKPAGTNQMAEYGRGAGPMTRPGFVRVREGMERGGE